MLDIDTGVLHLPDDEMPVFPCTALLAAKLETLAKVFRPFFGIFKLQLFTLCVDFFYF